MLKGVVKIIFSPVKLNVMILIKHEINVEKYF